MMLRIVLPATVVFWLVVGASCAFADTIVVKNDRGGSVTERTYAVHKLQREAATIGITGNCFSAWSKSKANG